jgi:arylsulfatase A-like enzyme
VGVGCGLLLAASVFCVCAERSPMNASAHHDRTNVLWVTICTLRSDHLGAYGYPKPVSPHIDDLAKRSFLFERTLTQAPWTRPSVASMLTAIYPRSLLIEDPEVWPSDRGLSDSFQTAAEYFHDAGYYTIGITANPNTNAAFNFDQGYDYYLGTEQLWRTGYAKHKVDARQVSAQLLDQLNGPAKGRKFFAHLVLSDTHSPYLEREGFGPNQGVIHGVNFELYDEQIRFVDEMLSRLFAQLGEMGLEDTLIVINSDHGEGFQEASPADISHGLTLYNSMLWVPLILYHPSFEPRARRISERVESVDVLPTLMDLLKLPFDTNALDGYSHAGSLLGDEKVETHEFGVVETHYELVRKSALLWKGWKLVVNYKPTGENVKPGAYSFKLTRYNEDVYERNNLASVQTERVEWMYRQLTKWQKERAARQPEDIVQGEISDQEREALRVLGYLDEAEGDAGPDDAGQ